MVAAVVVWGMFVALRVREGIYGDGQGDVKCGGSFYGMLLMMEERDYSKPCFWRLWGAELAVMSQKENIKQSVDERGVTYS